MSSDDAGGDGASDFTQRLVDRFFAHWYLYLLPVLALALLGAYSASNIVGDYASVGRLNATANPYVTQPDIRGTEIGAYETPAAATSRLINEQIGTDRFVSDVAERADLADAVNAGLITLSNIRGSIGAGPAGTNNLTIGARWSEPETARRLTEATIAAYTEYLAQVAAADSAEAVGFWTERKDTATIDVEAAEAALNEYLADLPAGQAAAERSTEQVFEIERLNSAVSRALDVEREAQTAIDEAEFAVAQAQSASARSLVVIDPPAAAAAPSPVRRDQIVSFLMFSLLGLVISFGALVLTTVLDRTVRTGSQLGRVTGAATVVTVPRLKGLRGRSQRAQKPPGKAA